MPPTHRGMVAANGGLVPLPNGDWRAMALDPNALPPAVREVKPICCIPGSHEGQRVMYVGVSL